MVLDEAAAVLTAQATLSYTRSVRPKFRPRDINCIARRGVRWPTPAVRSRWRRTVCRPCPCVTSRETPVPLGECRLVDFHPGRRTSPLEAAQPKEGLGRCASLRKIGDHGTSVASAAR